MSLQAGRLLSFPLKIRCHSNREVYSFYLSSVLGKPFAVRHRCMLLKQFMSTFSSKKNAIVKDVYIFLVSVLEHHSILLTCTCFTLARACNSVKWTMSATMDVHALNVAFYKAREISQQGLVKLITCMQF